MTNSTTRPVDLTLFGAAAVIAALLSHEPSTAEARATALTWLRGYAARPSRTALVDEILRPWTALLRRRLSAIESETADARHFLDEIDATWAAEEGSR